MATTAIWSIKRRSVRELLLYCMNPDKTNQCQYVSGVNCNPQTANEEIRLVKQQFGKMDGILAFHGYQSFRPGEVTAEQAHKIGVELVQRLWGDRFQVLVCTHTDRAHIHNHFVLNSVSFLDGGKYNDCKHTYTHMRNTSDKICREFALSVIESKTPNRTKQYAEWSAEQDGKPTMKSIIQEDVDQAIKKAFTEKQFFQILIAQGYDIKRGKDITLRLPGRENGMKLKRNLGEDYSIEAIRRRIIYHDKELYKPMPKAKPFRPYRYKGRLRNCRKQTGYRALYFCYFHRLKKAAAGQLTKKQTYYLYREDILKLDSISAEARLLSLHHIDTADQLNAYRAEQSEHIQSLAGQRKQLYNKIRHSQDSQFVSEIKSEISTLSEQIKKIRREVHLCDNIAVRSGYLKPDMQSKKNKEREEKNREYIRRSGRTNF